MVLEFLIVGMTAISSVFQSDVVFSSSADFTDNESLHSAMSGGAVVSDCASVTVFTHGLGGSAYDWLSRSSSQDGDSPRLDIEKNGEMGENGVYKYKNHGYLPFEFNSSVYILRGDSQFTKAILDNNGYFSYETPDNMTINLNEHLVVLFDHVYTSKEYESTKEKYKAFEKAIDSILYKYLKATTTIPKINLVGHSLGGIINTMYAVEHPAFVSNLIGIGTPYLGSRWAKALDGFQKVIDGNYVSNTKDIIDPSFYLSVLEQWLKAKEDYSINAVAISCTQSYEFFAESVDRAIAENGPIMSRMCSFFSPLRDVLDIFKVHEAFNLFVNEFLSTTVQVLKDTARAAEFAARILAIFKGDGSVSQRVADALASFIQILSYDFKDDTVMGSLLADCCVEEESQRGIRIIDGETKDFGFTPVSIYFRKGAYNYERAEFYEPGFLHNFEPKAPEVVSKVRSILTRTPEDLHTHDFALAVDDDTHYASCTCGAKVHIENHGPYSLFKTTGDLEFYRCDCGYEITKAHAKVFASFDSDGHVFRCKGCGLEGSEAHSLGYFDFTKLKHMARCACGYSAEEAHYWLKGRCVRCNRSSQSQLEIVP